MGGEQGTNPERLQGGDGPTTSGALEGGFIQGDRESGKHGVYELVSITSLPNGRKVVGTRWAYNINADGVYKGRLVMRGWSQTPGIDCGGTFAPVCRLQSIWMVLAIAPELDYEVFMVDVQETILNADVEEKCFVKMAPGYERSNESGVPPVMKLKKSLYGLRQSPKNWFSTMDHHLGKVGLRSLKPDPFVYVYEGENGSAILTIYMDDILLLDANKQLLDKLKKQLMDCFEMMDMGDASRVLGTNVTRDREEETININQKDYMEYIVQRYGVRGCNPAYTPGVGPELSLDQSEEKLSNEGGNRRYRSVMGVAMHLAQVCRYDIFYTVNQLARAMSKPSKEQMGVAKHLLRYLAMSTDVPITYKQGGFKLTAFSDTNWRANPYNGNSTSLYIIMLSNGPISFKVGIQGSTAQSTMNGGGIGGTGAHHKENSLLQHHNAGARLQGRVWQRAALHRQHIGTSRRRQPHIKPSCEAHRAEVLLCAGVSGGE